MNREEWEYLGGVFSLVNIGVSDIIFVLDFVEM